MTNIVFVDPTNWLADFNLQVQGQVYNNEIDGLRSPGMHIMINDFIAPLPYQKSRYDVTLYTSLENASLFKSKMQIDDSTYVISPTFNDNTRFFCNPAFTYSGAYLIRDSLIPKPNYNAPYLADVIIGHADTENKIGRAWTYYHVLTGDLQQKMIVTARHRSSIRDINLKKLQPDVRNFIENGHDRYGEIGPHLLPNYERFEKNIWKQTPSDEFPTDLLSRQITDSNCTDFFMNDLIYQASLYSVLMADCSSVYFDEKIARALIARRPFIVIGPRHYLYRLHQMGFRTFDPVIDESYDSEPNDHRRWSMAFDALDKLSAQNPQSVYDRLRKRLQHNRKLAYNSEYWIAR